MGVTPAHGGSTKGQPAPKQEASARGPRQPLGTPRLQALKGPRPSQPACALLHHRWSRRALLHCDGWSAGAMLHYWSASALPAPLKCYHHAALLGPAPCCIAGAPAPCCTAKAAGPCCTAGSSSAGTSSGLQLGVTGSS